MLESCVDSACEAIVGWRGCAEPALQLSDCDAPALMPLLRLLQELVTRQLLETKLPEHVHRGFVVHPHFQAQALHIRQVYTSVGQQRL